MKATVDARTFAQMTSRVLHTAAKGRVTLPILANVLLRVEGTTLTLQTTNLEQATSTTLWAGDAEDGAITVDAKWLSEVARRRNVSGVVFLETGQNAARQVTLTVQGPLDMGRLTTTGIDAEEFPSWHTLTRPDTYETCYRSVVSCSMLRMIGDLVLPAAAREESRITMTGLSMQFRVDGLLEVAGTDGYRLSVFEGVHSALSGASVFPAGCSCIMPASTVRLLPKVLPVKTATGVILTIDPGANVAEITAGDVVLRTRLIEGRFINYRMVMPATSGASVSVDRSALLNALAAVLPPGTTKSDSPVVRLDVEQTGLTLTQRTDEHRAEITLPIIGGGALPITLYLMAPMLREALQMFPSFGRIILRCTSATKPVVFVGDPDPALPDDSCCHLLMPASIPVGQTAAWKAA